MEAKQEAQAREACEEGSDMDMMLHEWLKGLEDYCFPETETSDEICERYGVSSIAEALRRMGEEIERYYILLPCDPEGNPWKIGDEFEWQDLHPRCEGYLIFEDEWYLRSQHSQGFKASECKRPTPKVCDADGVECKKGDRIYPITKKVYSDAEGYIVDHIEVDDGINSPRVYFIDDVGMSWMKAYQLTHEKPVFDAEGERIKVGDVIYANTTSKLTVEGFEGDEDEPLVWCGETKHGVKICYLANDITHREPDSLEKLRDEISEAVESWGVDDFDWRLARKWSDRLTSLIERGAK